MEEQSARYADSELNYIQQAEIAFLYESTGVVTRFTNRNDPAPRAREVFNFHRPETLQKWASEGKNTLRAKLKAIPLLNPNHLSASELGLRNCQLTAIENMGEVRLGPIEWGVVTAHHPWGMGVRLEKSDNEEVMDLTSIQDGRAHV